MGGTSGRLSSEGGRGVGVGGYVVVAGFRSESKKIIDPLIFGALLIVARRAHRFNKFLWAVV